MNYPANFTEKTDYPVFPASILLPLPGRAICRKQLSLIQYSPQPAVQAGTAPKLIRIVAKAARQARKPAPRSSLSRLLAG